METEVEIRDAEVSAFLRAIFRDQLPFATSLAINNTAKDFQKAERKHIHREFEVRRERWVDRSVKIKPFSSKRSLEARVSIDPPGAGTERADILAKFEEGGLFFPHEGHRSFAIPVGVRRLKSGVVSKRKRPKAFNFTLWGRGPEATVYRGDKRTFMIRRADGTGGIYKRMGRRGHRGPLASTISTRKVRDLNIRTLYRFTPRAHIDSRLEFEKTGRHTVRASFASNFEDAFDRAIKSGRSVNVGRHRGKTIIKASKTARAIARADVADIGRVRPFGG